MSELEYEPKFQALIDVLLLKLVASPWDLNMLRQLRMLALRRTALGIREKQEKGRPTREQNELLAAYRQMAESPLAVDPVVKIVHHAKQFVQAHPDDSQAMEVCAWFEQLAAAMRRR